MSSVGRGTLTVLIRRDLVVELALPKPFALDLHIVDEPTFGVRGGGTEGVVRHCRVEDSQLDGAQHFRAVVETSKPTCVAVLVTVQVTPMRSAARLPIRDSIRSTGYKEEGNVERYNGKERGGGIA